MNEDIKCCGNCEYCDEIDTYTSYLDICALDGHYVLDVQNETCKRWKEVIRRTTHD